MPEKRIELDESKLPVEDFFNLIPDVFFVETLEGFSRGIGASFNDVGCMFPGELEANEDSFEGVEFNILDEYLVVIPYIELMNILYEVTSVYI